MTSSIWKQGLYATALSLTSLGTASAQTPASAPLAALTSDEALFDSNLLAQQASCTVGCPPANCLGAPGYSTSPYSTSPYNAYQNPGAAPSTTPQLSSPDSVFQPNSLASLSAGQGALTGQNSIAASMMGGYLDPVAPATMFRLRYDIANNNQFADRGEYFYAKCGCFRQTGADPDADGPIGANNSVDYQEIRAYFEYAFDRKFSVFTELPVRFVDFDSLPVLPSLGNSSGFGDMTAGFKYAIIAEQDEYLTFQFKTYIPTGDSRQGLGTNHVSLEPAILYYRRLSENWLLQSQFSEFCPIAVESAASNVLSYGAGLGYILYESDDMSVVPMLETVGWTFLGGSKFNPLRGESSANGDTIVNVKPGVRVGFGDSGPAMMQSQSIYAGFGIPVTSEEFYEELFRVEYRILF